MIETKIKCDVDSHYSYEKGTVTFTEAIRAKWWQILTYCGDIRIRQLELEAEFNPDAKHACCAEHARELIMAAAHELVPDEEPKAKAAPADAAGSDIPY